MLPPGKYYVGDLCYIMSHEDWKSFLGHTSYESGEFNLPEGYKVAIYRTAYGDGEYFDKEKNNYCVDSGTIGCIPLSKMGGLKYAEYGCVHHFDKSFETGYKKGIIYFGNVRIDTNGNPEKDEYE